MNELLEYMYSLPREERENVAQRILKSLKNPKVSSHPEVSGLPRFQNVVSKPKVLQTEKKRTTSKKLEHPQTLNPNDEIVFQKLRTWRNQVAQDLEVPAYLVFSNDTLKSIAHYKPKTDDEFLKIKGMGGEKCGKYSYSILEILGNVENSSESFQQRFLPPNTQNETNDSPPNNHGKKWTAYHDEQLLKYLKDGSNYKTIAYKLGRTLGGIKARVERYLELNDETNYDEIISKYNIIDKSDRKCIHVYLNRFNQESDDKHENETEQSIDDVLSEYIKTRLRKKDASDTLSDSITNIYNDFNTWWDNIYDAEHLQFDEFTDYLITNYKISQNKLIGYKLINK
jgi:hypothetical protein